MEPPSYEESRFHPPALDTQASTILPPPYETTLPSPLTPPPTYGEAVTVQPDPFPLLNPPRASTTATSPSQNPGIIIHPITQIGVTPSVDPSQTQAGIVTQPQPVPFSVTYLMDTPGLVQCPRCHHTVTTEVRYQPGRNAWCMCIIIMASGLICGCCLIPFMVPSLQDAHHSCPQCRNHLHTYKR